MNVWILIPIGVGVILFVSSLVLAFKAAFKEQRFSTTVALSFSLTLLSVFWIALGAYAYFIIQSQMGN